MTRNSPAAGPAGPSTDVTRSEAEAALVAVAVRKAAERLPWPLRSHARRRSRATAPGRPPPRRSGAAAAGVRRGCGSRAPMSCDRRAPRTPACCGPAPWRHRFCGPWSRAQGGPPLVWRRRGPGAGVCPWYAPHSPSLRGGASWPAGDPSVAVGQSGHRPNAHVGARWSDGRSTRRKIWCSRISEGVPQASDQAVARHRVWQRWPETATRLRPCGAGQAGTDARLRPAAWPLSWEDRDAEGQRGWAGTGGRWLRIWRLGVRILRGTPPSPRSAAWGACFACLTETGINGADGTTGQILTLPKPPGAAGRRHKSNPRRSSWCRRGCRPSSHSPAAARSRQRSARIVLGRWWSRCSATVQSGPHLRGTVPPTGPQVRHCLH